MRTGHEVYAGASGPLPRLAEPLAARSRARRHARFFPMTGLEDAGTVLDVGCGSLGLRALAPHLQITGLDLSNQPSYPGPFVQADATARIPFGDREFDLVYCSSVIEHVPPERRMMLAAEIGRVGRGFFVQSPAFTFPIEPHSLLPFVHWLPDPLRRRYWRIGAEGPTEPVALLRRAELEGLFGVRALPEWLGPLVKSWVLIKPVSD